jgi:hypothetical protein
MKYKLTILEKVDYRHEVIIETEQLDVDAMLDYVQDEIDGTSGLTELLLTLRSNKSISSMMTVVNSEEDESGQSEWEIEDYEKTV